MPFRWIKIRKKRKHSATGQEILDRLERYIESNQDKPMRILVTHWRDQQDALSYREIREAILNEGMTGEFMREWTQDYSRFVVDKMTPVWREAMQAGSHGQPIMDNKQELLRFDLNNPHSHSWIDSRGASFVTSISEQQHQAVQSLIRQYSYEKYGIDELAKVIRPCVGLTDGQSRAVMRYYDSLKARMREDHPRMREKNLEERCREKAMIYAERLHRDRARMIAQTEMAFAYNHGTHESIRQAMQQGLLGTMEKRWLTSGNENVCPQCDALNGVQIGFDAEYDFGKHRHLFDGQEESPPLHPRCACCLEYIEVAPPLFEPDQEIYGVKPSDLDMSVETYDRAAQGAERHYDSTEEIFHNPKEFSEYLRRNGFIHQMTDTLKDGDALISEKAMTDLSKAIELIQQKVPKALEAMRYIELDTREDADNYAWTKANGEIVLGKMFTQENYRDMVRSDWIAAERGWFVKLNNAAYHPYVHEIGHNVEMQISGMIEEGENGNKRLWKEIYEKLDVAGVDEMLDKYPVSAYPVDRHSKREWFAETFCSYIDGENAPEYAIALGEIIERHLGG